MKTEWDCNSTIVRAHGGAAREVALYLSIGGDIPLGGWAFEPQWNYSGLIAGLHWDYSGITMGLRWGPERDFASTIVGAHVVTRHGNTRGVALYPETRVDGIAM